MEKSSRPTDCPAVPLVGYRYASLLVAIPVTVTVVVIIIIISGDNDNDDDDDDDDDEHTEDWRRNRRRWVRAHPPRCSKRVHLRGAWWWESVGTSTCVRARVRACVRVRACGRLDTHTKSLFFFFLLLCTESCDGVF